MSCHSFALRFICTRRYRWRKKRRESERTRRKRRRIRRPRSARRHRSTRIRAPQTPTPFFLSSLPLRRAREHVPGTCSTISFPAHFPSRFLRVPRVCLSTAELVQRASFIVSCRFLVSRHQNIGGALPIDRIARGIKISLDIVSCLVFIIQGKIKVNFFY